MKTLIILLLFSFGSYAQSPLAGKRVCIDPGHGGTAATDNYRVGKMGEREEWMNLRVALILRDLLKTRGALVILTRDADQKIELASRAKLARDSAVDLFISIHHNATADSTVNFPIIYFHGAMSENQAGVQLAGLLGKSLLKHLYRKKTPVSVVSDFTVFPQKGAGVLRDTYGIPGVLCEASFFTNRKEEERLKLETYNRKEAQAYAEAIELFFRATPPPILPKKIPYELPAFEVAQEADRMKPEALLWLRNYKQAKKLMRRSDIASLNKAYSLFTRSARSFPDSWVAGECHIYRSRILEKQNRMNESKAELQRAKEYYLAP